MPSAQTFDAIIIGAGQAGPPLAGRLTKAGMRVAMIERKLFGGTCVNTGCIPTKALIASARAVHVARRGTDFGFNIAGPITVDMKAVKARKDGISGKSRTGAENWLKTMANCTVFEGHARFESPTQVRVGSDLLEAGKIFINVGARAAIPDVPGIHESGYLTNSSIMAVDFLPKHLVIVGGSYIGVEFGQMYRRFGSEVTIIQNSGRLIPREDEDVSACMLEILRNDGIDVRLNASAVRFERLGDQPVVHLSTGEAIEASHLLMATGRRPNTDDLGLEKAGIKPDAHGFITVDDQLRTTNPNIWAMGDCNGRGAFTHTSYNDFEIVVANLLDNDPRRVSDRITAYNIYSDPPLGRAGLTEAQVREQGIRALIGTRAMTRVGRAFEKSETQGFIKILVDAKSHQILGASIVGVEGDEVIHCILDVMYSKQPYTVLQRATNIHPTVSELIPTVLGDLKPLDT